MLTTWIKALIVAGLSVAMVAAQSPAERAAAIVDKLSVDDMLGQMTQITIDEILDGNANLDEAKVRQFAKLHVGSFLNSPFSLGWRNGKPGWTATEWRKIVTRIQEIYKEENKIPMIFGLDSVHGANYVQNATLFGQQINAGASFNPGLVRKMGEITGRDTVAGGVTWVFGPTLEISQNPLWPRTYETFGEDPYLVSVMGAEIIKGIQSNPNVAACMKHFIAYSKTSTGHDRDGVTLSDFDLLNYFAPPFVAAVQAGVKTAMENYISINGVPVMSSSKILRQLIRDDMSFDGVILTDWAEINNLYDFHRVARSVDEAVRIALTQTSVDMSMVPYNAGFIDLAKMTLQKYPEYSERLKDSARRIIRTKIELGILENPVPGAENVNKVGQQEDREVALALARESVVLLKNKDNVLPLAESASVFLTGPSADNIGNLNGGWTLTWQGDSGNGLFPNGVSIKQGLEAIGGDKVSFLNTLGTDGNFADLEKVTEMARAAAYTVVVIGEGSYAEKPGDINDLALPGGQVAYVKALAATGSKVIVVLVGGRPRLLSDLPGNVHAIINAMLPGDQGGRAIGEIIYGKVNPSGRLPLTYPKDPANIMIPYNHLVTTACADKRPCQMEWNFGTGLSYTTFTYSNLKLSKTLVTGASDSITATVTVTNSGDRAGKETVMLFLIQPFRSISVPEAKMLKKFVKIDLEPGQSRTVEFKVESADWSVFKPQIGRGFARVAEDGDFVVAIKPETECNPFVPDTNDADMCATFTLKQTDVPPVQEQAELPSSTAVASPIPPMTPSSSTREPVPASETPTPSATPHVTRVTTVV